MASLSLAVLILPVLCLICHYETLRLLTCILPSLRMKPRPKILVVLGAALCVHAAEIVLYAIAMFALLPRHPHATALRDALERALAVSVESYASLGTSHDPPSGLLRIFAGSESVVGLILIGWTTSYTYLVMSELWREHEP